MCYFKKLIITTLFLTLSAFAHNHGFDNVKIKTIEVKDGIYMLMGRGGNIGLSVGDDGVFMIDDQFAPLSEKIKTAISKITDKKVKFLINTHWHFDHVGGNENFSKDGVVIVSHNNVRNRMSKDGFIKAFNRKTKAATKAALPIVTFNDTITFHLNNEQIEILHMPNSHTDGDSVIFFKSSNVIHTGDIFFNGFYPFIDKSSKGSIDGVIKSVEYILSKADDKTQIIPGHGKLANKDDLKVYRDTLIILKERMKKLIDDGKSLEEIIAMKPNADIDKKWGGGFLNPENFLRILYDVVKND